ncbi:hypothetical protein BDR26DRAFT_917948 [Obelidium mucronatum]|nr:hypothetical protein BDR26DRAFT_917948 [Obelidium mucronatum]
MIVGLRTVAVARPLLARAGSSAVGPWGPMNFAGSNWVGKGALPFGFRNRTVWYIGFVTTTALIFSIPFISLVFLLCGSLVFDSLKQTPLYLDLEIAVHSARPAQRKAQAALIEQMREETSMKL